MFVPRFVDRQQSSFIAQFEDDIFSSRLALPACMQLSSAAIMTRHYQGPPPRSLQVSQARQVIEVNKYSASGGDKQCGVSLTRGEAARAQGDEIVFDVHLQSSCLIARLACSYNI